MSIQFKLVSVAIIQTLVMIGILVYILYAEQQKSIRQQESANQRACASFAATLVSQIDAMNQVTKFPVMREGDADTALYNILSAEPDASGNYRYQVLFRGQAKVFIDFHEFIDTIAIYDNRREGVFLERDRRNDAFCTMRQPLPPWASDVLAAKGAAVLVAPGQFSGAGIPGKDSALLCVGRSVINTEMMKSVGIVVSGMDTGHIDHEFDKVRLFRQQGLGLYAGGKLVYGSGGYDLPGELPPMPTGSYYDDAFMDSVYHYDERYAVLLRTDMDAVLGTVQYWRPEFAVVAIALVLISAYVIYSISGGVLAPINELAATCKRLENQDFTVDFHEPAPREIQRLFSAFRRMSKRIDVLINDMLASELAQNQLEIQLLRLQVSPHYLYNTLESMRMIAYANRDFKVFHMAGLLARNLQYGLRGTNDRVFVREELASVRDYFELITFRYGPAVRMNMQIAEDVLQLTTIKFIVQPLVENAIVHGFSGDRQSLAIDIAGYCRMGILYFVISDDGYGMTPGQMEEVSEMLEREHSTAHIGLRNVHKRLKLYYGEPYGLSVQSRLGVGTTVTVAIPAQPCEGREDEADADAPADDR